MSSSFVKKIKKYRTHAHSRRDLTPPLRTQHSCALSHGAVCASKHETQLIVLPDGLALFFFLNDPAPPDISPLPPPDPLPISEISLRRQPPQMAFPPFLHLGETAGMP